MHRVVGLVGFGQMAGAGGAAAARADARKKKKKLKIVYFDNHLTCNQLL